MRTISIRWLYLFLFIFSATSICGKEPAQYYKAQGDYFLHKKELSRAILAYHRALRITAEFPECYFQLAKIYLKTGQHTSAIRNYKRVIALRHRLVEKQMLLDTYLALAKAHHRLGKLKKAIYNKDDVIMMYYINKVIDAFKSDATFITSSVRKRKNRLFSVNRFYYLAKAYFIRGRYRRDHKQSIRYHEDYLLCLKYLKYDMENYFPQTIFEIKRDNFIKQLLKLKQKHPGQWKRAAPLIYNISVCLYFLWENNHHRGNHSTARNYKNWALALNPHVFNLNLDEEYFDVFRAKK